MESELPTWLSTEWSTPRGTQSQKIEASAKQLRTLVTERTKHVLTKMHATMQNFSDADRLYLHAFLVTQATIYRRFSNRSKVGLASIDQKIKKLQIDLSKDSVLNDEINRFQSLIKRDE